MTGVKITIVWMDGVEDVYNAKSRDSIHYGNHGKNAYIQTIEFIVCIPLHSVRRIKIESNINES